MTDNSGETRADIAVNRVTLSDFKAFDRFTLHVRGDAFLAGPNNAGKSTLIAALRAAAQMLRTAMRRNPTETFMDRSQQVLGYAFRSANVALADENLRHEFRDDAETRLSVGFSNSAVITAVWPEDGTGDPFFYLQQGHASINNIRQARDAFPDIGVVPVLSPIDSHEELLTPKYVRDNLDGRLASRHFRNQLRLLQEHGGDEYKAFLDFLAPWLSEIRLRSLRQHYGERNAILDLYYRESGRRAEKEMVWAGDGIQIWLQLLLHVFRLRDRDVIVLDEPDVFLHPDLQHRLVLLLESLRGQTITATHSSEVLAEAAPESVIWIDKTRKRSVAAPSDVALAALSQSLGTSFNIGLARAFRAKCALFVEGDDGKILRQIAATIDAPRIATETGLAIVPLRGFDNWQHVEPFAWMIESLLGRTVQIFVLLDRDYRSEEDCKAVKARLRALNARCHIWKRKELESYLLEPSLIARAAGAPEDWVENALAEAAEESEDHVFGQITADALQRFPRDHQTQAAKEARTLFKVAWEERSQRKWVAPADAVLGGLNRRLESAGHTPVSFRLLARRMRASEVPAEMASFLDAIEDALDAANVPLTSAKKARS
jgi:predicted ATPase